MLIELNIEVYMTVKVRDHLIMFYLIHMTVVANYLRGSKLQFLSHRGDFL